MHGWENTSKESNLLEHAMTIVAASWIEEYYTDGVSSYRMYAREWKLGEDPYKEGLWRVCIQPMERGVVLAEQVTEYFWMQKEEASSWAKNQLPKRFRTATKKFIRGRINFKFMDDVAS